MSTRGREVEELAVGWIIRLQDPDFNAWEEFMIWLEEDSSHRATYDRLAVIDAETAERLFSDQRNG